jgi:predicted metal-dependent phosphotriesterase family hydrolase
MFYNYLGHYVALTQSNSSLALKEEEMYNLIAKELTYCCENCRPIKAGFIGEVGSTWPIEGNNGINNYISFHFTKALCDCL